MITEYFIKSIMTREEYEQTTLPGSPQRCKEEPRE